MHADAGGCATDLRSACGASSVAKVFVTQPRKRALVVARPPIRPRTASDEVSARPAVEAPGVRASRSTVRDLRIDGRSANCHEYEQAPTRMHDGLLRCAGYRGGC